jgi:hypothetical protein
MKPTFLDRVRESLTAAMAEYNNENNICNPFTCTSLRIGGNMITAIAIPKPPDFVV